MRILHLTLKKQWFDMIASGQKTEEYRENKHYWRQRLFGKKFDEIHFRNGYSKSAPRMVVECRGISSGVGNCEWGAPRFQDVYIIYLGAILEPAHIDCALQAMDEIGFDRDMESSS